MDDGKQHKKPKGGRGTMAGPGNLSRERNPRTGPDGYRNPCGYNSGGKKRSRKQKY